MRRCLLGIVAGEDGNIAISNVLLQGLKGVADGNIPALDILGQHNHNLELSSSTLGTKLTVENLGILSRVLDGDECLRVLSEGPAAPGGLSAGARGVHYKGKNQRGFSSIKCASECLNNSLGSRDLLKRSKSLGDFLGTQFRGQKEHCGLGFSMVCIILHSIQKGLAGVRFEARDLIHKGSGISFVKTLETSVHILATKSGLRCPDQHRHGELRGSSASS
mmetsp:Transcript_15703/g.30342  ORF Transcript_15703/g.30342 Transcript_15703/m.30342 type:complete len:220 (+) Transcript_15703:450-1109(+)